MTYTVSRLNTHKYHNSLSSELLLLQHYLTIGVGKIKLKYYLFSTCYILGIMSGPFVLFQTRYYHPI